uniref:NADH-ubiquinone oxidoreductase chain 3 n=1 Tax=Hoplopleura sp. TaxID=2782173 RepID=A0A7S8WWA4_9NEOP|nr:NADH dehydrogenase subunit 3 [Hoplopleura sp.]
MISMLVCSTVSMLFAVLISLIPILFQSSETQPSAAMEPFECGFDPLSPRRTSYFVHFFSVGIVFVLFDLETMLIVPLLRGNTSQLEWMGVWIFLWILLLMGLIMEIFYGSIDWKEIS